MIKNHLIKRLTCFIALIFILSVVKGKAQGDEGRTGGDLKFGVKGGVNMSSLNSGYWLPDFKVGYQIGGFAAYKVNSLISLELDALYADLGIKVIDPRKLYIPTTPGINNIIKSGVRMQAVEVPLLVNFELGSLGSKARVFVGPEVNFYLSATATNTRVENNGQSKSKTDVTNSFQNYDFAGVVGLSVDLLKSVSFEVRYRYGITGVNYIRSSAFKDFGLNALSANIGISF